MITKEKFMYQFLEQVKRFMKLEPDEEMQYFVIDGNRLDIDDCIGMFRKYVIQEHIENNEVQGENLCVHFNGDNNLLVTLERVLDDDPFDETEPPYVDILHPGRYTLELEKTLREPIVELEATWKRLSYAERTAFLSGIKAANTPPAKVYADNDDIF
jgi:hypothetical protein